MSTVLDDVTDEQIDARHIRRRVDDWEARVRGLYDTICGWLPDGWTSREGLPVSMHEEMMRRSGVAAREIPTLLLSNGSGKSARLEPRGLWIIGSNGRVDMKCGNLSLPDCRHGGEFRSAGLAGCQRGAAARASIAHGKLAEADASVRDLRAIAALYVQIDNFLESLRKTSDANVGGHDRIADRQRINDQRISYWLGGSSSR